jgi:hypothetical protein
MTSLPPIPRRLQDLVETCFEEFLCWFSSPFFIKRLTLFFIDEAGIEVLDEIRGSDTILSQ